MKKILLFFTTLPIFCFCMESPFNYKQQAKTLAKKADLSQEELNLAGFHWKFIKNLMDQHGIDIWLNPKIFIARCTKSEEIANIYPNVKKAFLSVEAILIEKISTADPSKVKTEKDKEKLKETIKFLKKFIPECLKAAQIYLDEQNVQNSTKKPSLAARFFGFFTNIIQEGL